jgi:hypothetical protein
MPTTLAEILFGSAAAIIAIAQFFILRSTRRGMKLGPPGSGSLLEWTFAVLPAVCLVGLLVWTWHTMHAGTFNFDSKIPAAGVHA